MQLPAWLPLEAWEGWCEVRQKMKRVPFTERAKRLALRQLEDWHNWGYDIEYVLNEATLKGWRGIFINASTPRVMRDEYGTYKITAEGTRKYIQ